MRMSNYCRCLALLMVTTVSVPWASAADPLDKARAFWASMASLSLRHSVDFSRIENGKLYQTGEYLREDEFILIADKIRSDDSVRFANPSYMAALAKRPKEPWRKRWFASLDSAFEEAAQAHFSDMFIMHITNPCGVASVLEDASLTTSLQLMPNDAGYTYKIATELPKNCQVHPAYAGAEVRIYGPLDRFPSKSEIIFAEPQGGPGTRIEFSELVQVAGITIPSITKATLIDTFGGTGKSPSEYRFDYSHFDAPMNTDRCYLAFYGLSEPASDVPDKRYPWTLYLVLAIVVLAAIIGGWRRYSK